MKFISYSQMVHDAVELSHKIPPVYSVIAGVPRSGMFVASVIALLKNVPLGVFRNGEVELLGHGARSIRPSDGEVLVVDDSSDTGTTLRDIRHQTAALYVTEESAPRIGYWHSIVPQPRVFEWNVFHHGLSDMFAYDMDGVICEDPPWGPQENLPRYMDFLENAKPMVLPSRKIGAIISGRTEQARQKTEQWLKKHGVQYGELLLMPDDHQPDGLYSKHAKFKADQYAISDYELYIESSSYQAPQIAKLSFRPVLCIEDMTLYE